MKILITLLFLISTSGFANVIDRSTIKCYEAPQQSRNWKLAYAFKTQGEIIKMIYPEELPLTQAEVDGEAEGGTCLMNQDNNFLACKARGQRIRGLVPVDINFKKTVYCEKSILDWISGTPEFL